MKNKYDEEYSSLRVTETASTIGALLDFPVHEGAAAPLECVLKGASSAFAGGKCDRVFMYNPDAVARWILRKHNEFLKPLQENSSLEVDLTTVFPPVTPVCFASMYSGLMPEVHGIQKYEKPVLKCSTVFDDIAAAGKKCAIVSTAGDSISLIFLGRNVDYFIYKTKQECNEKAMELIKEDGYDLIVLYNGDYDWWMHRNSPEGHFAKKALRENIQTYTELGEQIKKCWKGHNTVLTFAPDHGCHRWLGLLGTHGIDSSCDMNIRHFYSFIPESL